jgi:hypothetical protein
VSHEQALKLLLAYPEEAPQREMSRRLLKFGGGSGDGYAI